MKSEQERRQVMPTQSLHRGDLIMGRALRKTAERTPIIVGRTQQPSDDRRAYRSFIS